VRELGELRPRRYEKYEGSKMDYPKKFPKCPNCGSEVRVIESEAKEEMAKGNIKVVTRATCMVTETAVFDPTSLIVAPREVPMIRAFYDICADCGTLYCIGLEKGAVRAEPPPRKHDYRGPT
jgi:hypothetical protein